MNAEREKETKSTWNAIAKKYQDVFMELDLYNGTYDFFAQSLKENATDLLEIGCGPGNITRYFQSNYPTFKITATDIAKNMLALAKKNVPEVDFFEIDCRAISKINRSFDGVICGFTLPYLSQNEVDCFFEDTKNLLFPEGLFYISFVAGNKNQSGYQTGSDGHQLYFYYHPLDFILNLLEKHTFSVLDVSDVSFSRGEDATEKHTIIIAKRNSAKP